MSKTYISPSDRRIVRERAGACCEYCRLHEEDTDLRHEIDHIIAEKHGGATTLENLAFACFECNSSKGSDIASLSYAGELVRFFNPRSDEWQEHFRLQGEWIIPITPIGEATDRIFRFNTSERREERRGLQAIGRYPTE